MNTRSTMPSTTVSAVLLAAGGSRRMGRPKPLLPFAGEALIRRVARRVLAAEPTELLVVLGHRSAEVAETIADLPLRLIQNPEWEQGQSTSVAVAVRAFSPTAGAALFIPCDQPHLTPEVLRKLSRAHRESGSAIVVPTVGGERRSPVLIAAGLFPELLALRGDRGARQIFADHQEDLQEVPITDRRALLDIDTWEDYEQLAVGQKV